MSLLLDFDVFDKPVNQIDFDKNRIINTINPHSYCMTKKDKDFEYVLKNSDVLLPDGIGIVWASKVINKKQIYKIAGYDLFLHLMQRLEASKGSCFFMGASESTLTLIRERAAKDFPNVNVYTYSPPYKPSFSESDNNKILQEVNAKQPDVLFVGMTAPKQEKWAFEHKDALKADIICSIGAVFDFYAGTVERASDFWINLGLEWLPRFLKEPKRLAERNLVSTPKFIYDVFVCKVTGRNPS